MESVNSSSPIGKLFPVIVILVGLVALFYLYHYLFGARGVQSYTLLSKTQSASIDSSQPIIITSDKLPLIYEGGEFTISTWLYISNWSYRSGFNKSIINIGGPKFDTIRLYLGGVKPSISVRLQTREAGNINSSVPPAMNSDINVSISNLQSESLDKVTHNATFNILQTDSGILDSSPLCDLPEVDMQRWINISVAVNGKTVDVYMDGKLARSCVLPSFYKVDAGGYSVSLLSYGGFGGQISTTTMYDSALNPEEVFKNYMAGPEPITNIFQWISSFFAPGVSVSITSK